MDFRAYLFFGSNCRDAFTRYHEIFGGDLVLLPMSDIPDETPPPEQADLIIHAALMHDGAAWLMGSDDPTGGYSGTQGIMVACSVDEVAEAERIYSALADGGETTQPLTETFFSPSWGMCVDRFGTPWMVSTAAPEGG
jgi:PhnB protein